MAIATRGMFVNGNWVRSGGGGSDYVYNPSTEEVIAEVPSADRTDVAGAIDAAVRAVDTWSEVPPAERAERLLRIATSLEREAEEFVRLEMANSGKPQYLADSEVRFALDSLRFLAGAAGSVRSIQVEPRGWRSLLACASREPIGVVACLTSWNSPLLGAIWKVGSALAAGNSVVLKPSELTPLSALSFAEVAEEYLPPGVLNVITGSGPVTGRALIAHPQTRAISLTGSTQTGRHTLRLAGPGKKLVLELGGTAPAIVFEDVDIARVIEVVLSASYVNSGQNCLAIRRVLVHESLHSEFLSLLVLAARAVTFGNPFEADVDMGPMISPTRRKRLAGILDAVRAGGGRILAGGFIPRRQGFFYPATVIRAGGSIRVPTEDLFGPALVVERFKDTEDAIMRVNSTRQRLGASIWSRDAQRCLALARRLRFGTVWINTHAISISEMPHGGRGESGYGREQSTFGVEEFTHEKRVVVGGLA